MSCPRCNAPAAEETLREFGGVCPKCLLDFSEEQDAPAFPNLEIVEMVGQGGMGVVYKAVQKNLGRTVALKVLSPHLSDDPEFVERFTREARALASLSHPNIVGIYDSGIHDHVPFLVMEYIDGTPLRKMLASKKLTPAQVLEVIPQICDALHYAHEHGVVHRDIKPENILIDRQGRVKIADFGLAKLASLDETRITRTGYVMGSPHYMAPEQFAHSGRVDHRADIYSLGVVFYEMLTGEVPMGRFKAPSQKAAIDQRLDPVVLKSLEREPDDRWQSVEEVKARVKDLDGKPDEPTVVWNGIPILVVCTLSPKEFYGATETTVYVDGRNFGSGSGMFVDRVYGKFSDRQGREHTLEVRAKIGSSTLPCTVKVDGVVVWEGNVPVQNTGYGCAMVGIGLGAVVVASLAAYVEPWLLLAVVPACIFAIVALVRKGVPPGVRRAAVPTSPPDSDGEARRNRIAVAVLAAIAVFTIAVLLALTAGRKNQGIGGPVLVIIAGVVLMVLSATHFRFWKSKTRGIPPSSLRRQSTMLAGAAAGVVLLAVMILLLVTVPAPPPPPQVAIRSASLPDDPVTPGDRFLLADAWLLPDELPSGLSYEEVLEGKEVFRDVRPPGDSSTIVRGGVRWQDMMPDVAIIRRATLAEGHLQLFGIQFKTEYGRKKWENAMGFVPVPFEDGRTPLGLSFLHVSTPGYGKAPQATAAYDLLLPVLQRKMQAAAARSR